MSYESTLQVRFATAADLEVMLAIYNHYVLNSTATFDTVEQTWQERYAWFREHQDKSLPVIVLENKQDILGFASLSFYHKRCAYNKTAELSIYIAAGYTGYGLGKRLLSFLMTQAQKQTYHAIVALVCSENEASIKLFKSSGFTQAGCLKEVGRKFDRWLDVVLLQRIL